MPRAASGPRPINILATQDRLIYHALVERLRPSLPAETRSNENWKKFTSIGIDAAASSYLVEFDIASCYEYIDHATLTRELLLQSMDVEGVTGVAEFLGAVFGMPRGLPQLVGSSDLLSDTYLEGIERDLLRSGFEPRRYADDFKVVADDWGEANAVVEAAADIARKYGLVLSSGKTSIRKVETVREDRSKLVDFLATYFNAARDDLTLVDVFPNDYGDPEEVELAPSAKDAYAVAFRRILDEWFDSQVCREETENIDFHARHIPLALAWLSQVEERISDDLLDQIVFRAPLKLNAVLKYISARKEHSNNWESILRLASSERQSPWAKLWLLNAAQDELQSDDELPKSLASWAQKQLYDRHESVRAEAAWFLALAGQLAESELQSVAMSATHMSLPALAATAALSGGTSNISSAIKAESLLTRASFAWGERQK